VILRVDLTLSILFFRSLRLGIASLLSDHHPYAKPSA
jgi:hypothetical protein